MNVVITGGHTGLGLELTRQLVNEGKNVGIVVRSASRLADVPESVKSRLTVWEADLAQRDAIDAVAKRIVDEWSTVDVLFNNAGVLLPEFRVSPHGNEMHLEVNTLAPYRLTRRLEPALLAAEEPVVVNTVTGNMHAAKFDLAEVTDESRFQKLFGAYMHSKLALVLLMNELARDPAWKKVSIRNVNPGANKTPMTAGDGVPGWIKPFRWLLFSAPTKGARLLHRAAFDASNRGRTGVFFDEKKLRDVTHELADDDRAAIVERLGPLD